ncbi:MAG: hypothetical protein ACQEVA_09235 [Myxococcota bacterium]
MLGPRYRDFLKFALLLLVSTLVLSGCRREPPENPYAPNGEYFDRLDAAGQRILVVGPDDQAHLKLRKRLSHYKVYDSDMQPIGRISWEPSSEVRSRPRREGLRLERIGGDGSRSIEKSSEDVYELAGAARLERTNRGWAIFAAGGDVLGSLERNDDRWELARTYDGDERLRVVERDGNTVLLRGEEVLRRVTRGELGELELLMQGLTALGPLERTLIGAWFESSLASEMLN